MSGYQQPDDEAVVVARDIHVKADYLQVVKDQFMPGRTFLVSVCEHVGTRPIEAGVHMDEPRLRALIEDLSDLLPEHTTGPTAGAGLMTPHPLTVAAAGFAFGAAATITTVLLVDAVVRRARAAVEAATIDMDDWHVTGWGR